jgi:hypothetical protein
MDGQSLDLVAEALKSVADQAMDHTAPQPFGTYVFTPDDPGAALARHVEREVFEEAFGNSPLLLAEEYGPYESASVFFCVIDHLRRLPAGAARVILPSPAGLKSVNDVKRFWGTDLAAVSPTWTATNTWDVATLAVSAEYRGKGARGMVSSSLYQGICTSGRLVGVEHFITILDVPVLRLLQWQMGRGFTSFDGVAATSYLGSEASLPVWAELADWHRRLTESDEATAKMLFEGQGLEASVASPDWDHATDLLGHRAALVAATAAG